MNSKAVARFLYATVPGLAAVRFQAKNVLAAHLTKSEFRGVRCFSIGASSIVDIGANRGQSVAAFKALAKRATIVAFEPEPASAKLLARRYRGDDSVIVYPCALGNHTASITFYVPSYGLWNCDGMAATDRKSATEWLRDPGRMYRFDERKLTVREASVECRTLDSFALSPALIKVHAQGAELSILQGATETLTNHRPALMCAFPTPEVTAFLSEFGFRPYTYDRGGFRAGIAHRPVTFTWYLTDGHLENSARAAERQ